MTPPVEVFPAFELPSRVQVTTKGKRRKDNIDLEKCELLQIMQYECNIQDTKVRDSPIICEPIQRLFRRCANGLTVETTTWEQQKYQNLHWPR